MGKNWESGGLDNVLIAAKPKEIKSSHTESNNKNSSACNFSSNLNFFIKNQYYYSGMIEMIFASSAFRVALILPL